MRPDPQLIVCWAAKGGSGTTVTCATETLTHPGPVLLVGLDNDLPDVLATTPPPHGGVGGWLTAGQPRDHLDRLTPRTIDASTRFLTGGRPTHGNITNDRWTQLADWLHQQPGTVIVDAGTRTPPQGLLDAADRRLLLTRIASATARYRRSKGIVGSRSCEPAPRRSAYNTPGSSRFTGSFVASQPRTSARSQP